MPLKVTPIRSLTAYCVLGNRAYLTREFGPLFYWVYVRATVDSDTGPVVSEIPGFIRTTRSIFCPKDHNCDNMQLNGSVDDLSPLTGWYSMPAEGFPGYTGIPYVTYFSNVAGGVYDITPAPILVEAGMTSITKFIPASQLTGYMLWIVISASLSLFGHIESGMPLDPNYVGRSTDYVKFVCFKVTNSGYYARHQSAYLTISMAGKVYSMETVTQYIEPLARKYLTTAWWDPYYYSNTRRYSSSVVISDPNKYRDDYNSDRRRNTWMSVVENKTNVTSEFGSLHYRALSKVDGFSGNGFAYFRDVKNIIDEIKDLFALLKGSVTPDSISSLYLTWRYGMRLTAADTRELTHALKRAAEYASGVSATETVTVGTLSVKNVSTIRYKKHDTVFEKIYHFFRYLDLLPSADNIWDLIPYSFVLDWFVNIGSLSDQYDKLELIRHLDINAVYDSYKATYTGPASFVSANFIGNLTVSRYVRKCHTDASFPLIVTNSRSTISQWVDGLALIIQRLK